MSLHIDVNDPNSYDQDTKVAVSLSRWKYSKTSNQTLEGFGINQYDVAKASSLNSSLLINKGDNISLEPSGYHDELGVPIIGNVINSSDPIVGEFITLDGTGYLNGVFKYHGYEHELLPRRFNEGITIETTVLVNDNTFTENRTIFFMGTRAEDKFNLVPVNKYDFAIIENTTLNKTPVYVNIPNYGEVKLFLVKNELEYIPEEKIFKLSEKPQFEQFYIYLNGVLLDELDYEYNSYKNEIKIEVEMIDDDQIDIFFHVLDDQSMVFYGIDFEKLTYYTKTDKGLENSLMSIDVSTSRKVQIKINQTNGVNTYDSKITLKNGWNHIVMRFSPYIPMVDSPSIIDDDCEYANRLGVYTLYINGFETLKVSNMLEFISNGLETFRARQIGLPYNISWGGGTFGLKNSYIFEESNILSNDYEKLPEHDGIIESNFDKYFVGGLQILRIYTKSLSLSEIRNNFMIESEKLGIVSNKGGRVIYK